MKILTRQMRSVPGALLMSAAIALSLAVGWGAAVVRSQSRPGIATEDDFRRAMKELSNSGRWGKDDELGASNFITPATRKRAAALVKEGLAISLAHPVVQEGPGTRLERTLLNVSATGSADKYALTGTYHGSTFTHMDAVDCHVMWEGKGYNGVSMEEVKAANGCPKGDIDAQRDGVFTRGILFDATLLPGKATPDGWLEPGVAIHREDLEALEKIEGVKAGAGDIITLYTGRWKREAARGVAQGHAGYQADVAYFLKERSVALIAHDHIQDVGPTGFPQVIGNPLHKLALASLGVSIIDNLDLERAIEAARRLKRYEYLFTVAPLRIQNGTGTPVNPTAIF
jgi:kynurenine formamidase